MKFNKVFIAAALAAMSISFADAAPVEEVSVGSTTATFQLPPPPPRPPLPRFRRRTVRHHYRARHRSGLRIHLPPPPPHPPGPRL